MKIHIRQSEFEVDPGPFEIGWKHIGSGNWEPETFDIIDVFVNEKSSVLDLGAWAGPVSLYAASKAAYVYAIDPDPVIFEQLKKNVSLNPELAPKIKCCNLAISDKDAQQTLFARKKYGESSSSLLARSRDQIASHTIRGITLRTFLAEEKIQKIDFLKMDIEGGEFLVLPGIHADIERMDHPVLYISWHYDYLREHHYHLRLKWKFASRILMKLENLFGMDLFKKMNRKIVLDSLKALNTYKFVYTAKGEQLGFERLEQDPFLIQRNNMVFTNREWKR